MKRIGGLFLVGGALLSGCSRPSMPSPEAAVAAYNTAVQSGDVDALWAMMTEEARLQLSKDELQALLLRDEKELQARAGRLTAPEATTTGSATLFLRDGRQVSLALEDQSFFVRADGVLPVSNPSPMDAARRLREAVQARDYQLAYSVLSSEGQKRLSVIFEALDASLDGLELAVVEQRGDTAVIELPEGRTLVVRWENGSWVVEELR